MHVRNRKTPRSERHLAPYTETLAKPKAASTKSGAFVWSKAAAGLLVIAACLLGYRLFNSEHFTVQKVEIEGESLLSEAEIVAHLDVVGRSIFAVPKYRIAREVQSAFPLLESATVECILPNRLRLTVREWEVALAWESDGRFWWIGTEGRVLGETADPQGRLVVHDLKGLAPLPGEYVLGVPWEYLLALSRALPELREVDYALEEGVIAHDGEGVPILLGYEGDVSMKVAILKDLNAQMASRGAAIDYIDLRNAKRPAIKIR